MISPGRAGIVGLETMATKKTKKKASKAPRPSTKASGVKARSKAASKPAKKASRAAPEKKTTTRSARAKKKPSDGTGEALLRALTVAMIADGEIAASEREALTRFASQPLFRDVDVVNVVEDAIDRCIDEGPEAVLADVASKLRTKPDREAAFSSCLAIVATDGRVTASETRILRALAESLAIPHARAKALAGPISAVLD